MHSQRNQYEQTALGVREGEGKGGGGGWNTDIRVKKRRHVRVAEDHSSTVEKYHDGEFAFRCCVFRVVDLPSHLISALRYVSFLSWFPHPLLFKILDVQFVSLFFEDWNNSKVTPELENPVHLHLTSASHPPHTWSPS